MNSPSPAKLPPPGQGDLFDLAVVGHWALFVLRSPGRNRRLAILCATPVLLLGIVGGLLFPQRYEVSTTILAGSPLTGSLGSEFEREQQSPTRAAREILLRRDNLESLARQTNLAQRYLDHRPIALRARDKVKQFFIRKPTDPGALVESLVDTLEERLWVNVNDTGTVSIALQWWSDDIAYAVVDAAAHSFLEMRHAAEIKTVAEQIAILEATRVQLETEIERRIDELEQRDKSAKKGDKPRVVARRASAQPTDTEVTRLQSLLSANKRTMAELEAARQQRIVQVQAELQQQQSVFAPDHPAIEATRRVLDSLSSPSPQALQLKAEAADLEREIQSRGGVVVARYDAPAAQPGDDLQALFADDPRTEYERGQLANLRRQLGGVMDRISSAKLQMETAEAAFKHRYAVVTPPLLPKGPVKPYIAMFVVGGLIGGILLALFACVGADLRRGTVIETWQVEAQLGIPLLGQFKRS